MFEPLMIIKSRLISIYLSNHIKKLLDNTSFCRCSGSFLKKIDRLDPSGAILHSYRLFKNMLQAITLMIVFLLTCSCGGIHQGRVEPASPIDSSGNVSWIISTSRSPVPASLQVLALQLKPSLPSLRTSERPLFTAIQVTRRGREG